MATPAQALAWADSLAAKTLQFSPWVDLVKIARSVDVQLIRNQIMIPRGTTIAVSGGFEIYLRSIDDEEEEIDLTAREQEDRLTIRQRFTLAHEIAHTFFYRRSKSQTTIRPKPSHPFKDIRELEDLCDDAAGRILVPTKMLQKEVQERLGDASCIDAEFIRDEVTRFRVSPETLLERLRWAERDNLFARCIVLMRCKPEDVEIAAYYFGQGLLRIIPRPKKFSPLKTWFKGIPSALLDGQGSGEWCVNIADHELALRSLPWGRRGDFLLQVDLISSPPLLW